ncbi:MAG TPA: sialidase family protein [Bacteroidota bacterium]
MRLRTIVPFLVVIGISSVFARQKDWLEPLREIPVPAAKGSFAPSLKTMSDSRVLISWLEPGAKAKHALRYAKTDSKNWSEARTAVEGDTFFANWADVPSVVALQDGRFVAHWLNKSGASTYAYDVNVKISSDGGATWSSTMSPHHDGTETEHGFVSFFDSPANGSGLVWLDGRAMANANAANHDSHGAGGDMSLRALFINKVNDFENEAILDARTCECCPTAAVATDHGIVVAYRDRSNEEVRDIYATRYEDGKWSSPRPVHRDDWNISGCPVNGPALATDGKNVVLVWYTAANGEPKVNAAFSNDEGKTFGQPILLSEGIPLGRVAVVLLADGSAVATWIEHGEKAARLVARRVTNGGTLSSPYLVKAISADRASGYPRLARLGTYLFFAWTDTADGKMVKLGVAALMRQP